LVTKKVLPKYDEGEKSAAWKIPTNMKISQKQLSKHRQAKN
jgi:hypothetical protein